MNNQFNNMNEVKFLKKSDFSLIKDEVLRVLEMNKAIRLISCDLEGKTDIAYYMIIAYGTSSRHLGGLATIVEESVRKKFRCELVIEGLTSSEWIVIDIGGLIVHLFQEHVGHKYGLEYLYGINSDSRRDILSP